MASIIVFITLSFLSRMLRDLVFAIKVNEVEYFYCIVNRRVMESERYPWFGAYGYPLVSTTRGQINYITWPNHNFTIVNYPSGVARH
jgi:hypothetical protein